MPPNLEPASALASESEVFALQVAQLVLRNSLTREPAEAGLTALIDADRAAVREPLETQLDELRRRLHEQADVIAERDRRIGELEALFQQTHGCHHDWVERGDRAEKRIASLEAQLASAREEALGLEEEMRAHRHVANTKSDAVERLEVELAEERARVRWFVEKAADEKLDGYRELGQRAAEAENSRDDALRRIASLEAQLASAREEALRELIDRLRAEAGLHSAYDCTVLSMAIEGLLELLPAAQEEPSRG